MPSGCDEPTRIEELKAEMESPKQAECLDSPMSDERPCLDRLHVKHHPVASTLTLISVYAHKHTPGKETTNLDHSLEVIG